MSASPSSPAPVAPAPAAVVSTVLPEAGWLARAHAHETRVRAWTDPHQARAARGEKHPVYDFLFTYYSHRPSWLRRWFPGPGVALRGPAARAFLARPEYQEIEYAPSCSASPAAPLASSAILLPASALPANRRPFVAWLRALLAATLDRPAHFACFGLHEWAMVYRQTPDEVRHNQYPLRFPPAELAAIVESRPLACSHFDAFRFFTPPARPLNRAQLTRESAPDHEQPGCLHANMDLYKWAFKLAPFVAAELVADCFELARDIREVDMRASPYDLANLGFSPIKIETTEGRADYERAQRAFAARARPLRTRLLAACDTLLA